MDRTDSLFPTLQRVHCLVLMENQWRQSGIFPRFTSIEILRHIQQDLNARQINPEKLEGRNIFMSMFNDAMEGNSDACISNSREVSDCAKKFQRGHWSFVGPGDEEKWYETCVYKPEGKWNQQADQMIASFAQSGHPVFRGTSALSRGTLKRKPGRNTLHFTADSGNIDLIMRTTRSANQLSIYGGVLSW